MFLWSAFKPRRIGLYGNVSSVRRKRLVNTIPTAMTTANGIRLFYFVIAYDDTGYTHRPIESSVELIMNVWNEFLDIFISGEYALTFFVQFIHTLYRRRLIWRFGEYLSELTTESYTKSAIDCNYIFCLPKPLLLFAYRSFALVRRMRHIRAGAHRQMRYAPVDWLIIWGRARKTPNAYKKQAALRDAFTLRKGSWS